MKNGLFTFAFSLSVSNAFICFVCKIVIMPRNIVPIPPSALPKYSNAVAAFHFTAKKAAGASIPNAQLIIHGIKNNTDVSPIATYKNLSRSLLLILMLLTYSTEEFIYPTPRILYALLHKISNQMLQKILDISFNSHVKRTHLFGG